MEDDEIDCVYILFKGAAAYTIQAKENVIYL